MEVDIERETAPVGPYKASGEIAPARALKGSLALKSEFDQSCNPRMSLDLLPTGAHVRAADSDRLEFLAGAGHLDTGVTATAHSLEPQLHAVA